VVGEETPADFISLRRRVRQSGSLDLAEMAVVAASFDKQNAVAGLGQVHGERRTARSRTNDNVLIFLLWGLFSSALVSVYIGKINKMG
jgi:hypothetical protein